MTVELEGLRTAMDAFLDYHEDLVGIFIRLFTPL
jgi:hypothetical protein